MSLVEVGWHCEKNQSSICSIQDKEHDFLFWVIFQIVSHGFPQASHPSTWDYKHETPYLASK
jgi:hypothetical protein